MSLDNTQKTNDQVQLQQATDQNMTPLVNMANPNEVQSTFKTGDNSGQPAVTADGQMIFTNPYESTTGKSNWNSNNFKDGDWHQAQHGMHHHDAYAGLGNDTSSTTGAAGITDAGVSASSAASALDSSTASGTNPGDMQSSAQNALTSAATSGDTSTLSSADQLLNAQVTQLSAEINQISNELTTLLQQQASVSDNSSGTGSTPAGDNTATQNPPAAGGQTSGDATQEQTQNGNSGDPLVAALQQTDPTLASTLTDASGAMTAQGYSNLEQYVSQNYATSPSDASLMNGALTQSNLSSADSAALNGVLQQDMPSALTSADTGSTTDNTNTGTGTSTDSTNPGTGASTDNTNTGTTTNLVNNNTNPNTGDSTVSTTTTNSAPTGNYQVVNGQIIGPNGQPYDAKGVAIFASQAPADAATIMQQMPDLNFIRLAATPADDSPSDVQADIQAFQSINPNVVVEVEDHTSGGTDGTTNNTLSGSDLQNETNWYAQIASNNVNNANVWFGTANEPNDPFNEQNVVDQESAIYNAIRGTGNNNMVMLEADGGGSFGPQQADTSAYAGMTNVAWDDHYYGWVTNGDTSVQDNVSAIQNEVAGANGITESNGNGGQEAIPTIIGEYGNSTTGNGIDANGTAAIDAVQTANNEGIVQGAVGWVWNGNYNPSGADEWTADGTMNTVTTQGQEGIAYVNDGTIGAAS